MKRLASVLTLSFAIFQPAYGGWRIEGGHSYKEPEKPSAEVRAATLEASRDAVWTATVSYLSQTAFAIDQLSKESGLLSIKFSEPDPRRVIDCGVYSTWVSNMRGRRDYSIDGAQPQAMFEEFGQGKIFGIERTVTLTGVVNIFVLAVDSSHTSVRINVRYVAQKRNVVHDRAAEIVDRASPAVLSSAIMFNSGEVGVDDNGSGTKCVSRFAIEKQLLEGITAELRKLTSAPSTSSK